MLGIGFLKKPTQFGMHIAGMEFMDFQTDDTYRGLVSRLDKLVSKKTGEWFLDWTSDEREDIAAYLFAETGINIVLHEGKNEVANAAIDAGYLTPNNLLNNEGLDEWYDAKHTNVGIAFRSLKVDVLKGYVDTKTGKIGGDFSKVKFGLWIQEYLAAFLDEKILKKCKVTMAEALAGVILHEMGHAFGAFLFAFQTTIDSALPYAAIRLAMKADGTRQQAEIVKEAFKALECDTQVKEEHLELLTDSQSWRLYFDKALQTRNLRRSLSIGISSRASEVYADMYAMRMGAGNQLVSAISAMPQFATPKFFYAIVFYMIGLCWYVAHPIGAIYVTIAGICALADLGAMLLPGSDYDTTYRRMKGILREMVVQIQSSKDLDNKTKRILLDNATKTAKIVDENKPFLEGTGVQRMVGWILSGSEFKATDFEHYTHELLASNLAMYADYFKTEEA